MKTFFITHYLLENNEFRSLTFAVRTYIAVERTNHTATSENIHSNKQANSEDIFTMLTKHVLQARSQHKCDRWNLALCACVLCLDTWTSLEVISVYSVKNVNLYIPPVNCGYYIELIHS